jgi:hypothetical protein
MLLDPIDPMLLVDAGEPLPTAAGAPNEPGNPNPPDEGVLNAEVLLADMVVFGVVVP